MYLKKIRLYDNNIDNLKRTLGKQLRKDGNKLKEQEGSPRPIRYEGPRYINNNNDLYTKIQTFSMRTNPNDAELLAASAPRRYHLSDIVVPETRNVIAINDDSKAVSSGRITAKFNFVSEQYEKWSQSVSEPLLPCIYLESDPQQTKSIMDLKFFPRVTPKARHFYDFNYILKDRYQTPNERQFKNLMFGQNFSFAPGNAQKGQYPFYNRIKFNYRTNHDFKNMLKSFNFFEHLIDDYISARKNKKRFLLQKDSHQSTTVETQKLEMFDVTAWLRSSDFSLDGTKKVLFEPTTEVKNRYKYFMDKMSFAGKIRKLCKSKLPNIEDIINNKPVETETLFYRIDKYVGNSRRPVQQFWVPGDDDFVDYIDTQIKYGIKYTYSVNAYVLVYGCRYEYANKQTSSKRVTMDARIQPSFQIIEIPNIYTDYCRVVQPPQPVPTVKFVNEKNAKDYIKIYLNLTLNSNNEPLVPIVPKDMEQEELRKDYDRLEERDRFVYNNERALYEIYRTDFIPESYADLEGHKLTQVRNAFPSTGASHTDFIRPWKKYYYVFRSVNFHGLVSNCTPIYEVEMTKDADETFLSVQTVGFFKENVSQATRKFIKLLQAIPATQHTIFDDDNLTDDEGQPLTTFRGRNIDKINLGVAKHPIWGKKFKFRLTSTSTGKKLDINIMVNLLKKKTLENSK